MSNWKCARVEWSGKTSMMSDSEKDSPGMMETAVASVTAVAMKIAHKARVKRIASSVSTYSAKWQLKDC